MEKFRDTAWVAGRLGVSASTVRYWRYRGYGPVGVKIGRHVKYDEAAVEAWIGSLGRDQRSAQ